MLPPPAARRSTRYALGHLLPGSEQRSERRGFFSNAKVARASHRQIVAAHFSQARTAAHRRHLFGAPLQGLPDRSRYDPPVRVSRGSVRLPLGCPP